MPRLPQPGRDNNKWGEILNEFLSNEHNADGTLKSVARPSDVAAKYSKPSTGIPESDLDSGVQSKLNSGNTMSDASITTKGITKLSTAPTTATDPIAIAVTDPKVTADQAPGTASIRTLGYGANQAAQGSVVDTRLNTIEAGRVQDEGAILAKRQHLNFVGTGVTATDDSANNLTIITIPGAGAPTDYVSVKDSQFGPGGSYNHGALADGGSHPLSDYFATLAGAQVVYPFATSPTQELDWAASQKAINNNQNVHWPAGTYIIRDKLSKTTSTHLVITGAGFGLTTFFQRGNTDVFDITLTGSAASLTLNGFDFVAAANVAQITGAAVRVAGNANKPSAVISNCRVAAGGTPIGEFQYGIHLTDCAETQIDNYHVFGINTIECIRLTAAALPADTVAGPTRITRCSGYNIAYGVRIVTATNPGVEGVHVLDCDWVATDYGVHAVNSNAGYVPPQIIVKGGHINARITNIHLQSYTQSIITKVLLYASASGRFVAINDCSAVHVEGNHLIRIGTGDPTGIELSNANGGLSTVLVRNNTIHLKPSGTKYAVTCPHDWLEGRIEGNVLWSTGGPGFTNMYTQPRIVVRNNYPLDQADHYALIGVTGAGNDTLSVSEARSTFVEVANPGVARTVTTITPRREGETFKFRFLGNVTLQHNAGILLAGQIDAALTAGDIVTLTRANGTWFESTARLEF